DYYCQVWDSSRKYIF
nr:immunoglobulin light chain junction region [Macaca mulatta]